MRKIKWKKSDVGVFTYVGSLRLYCLVPCFSNLKTKWRAEVYVDGITGSLRCGLFRHSLSKVKEDAIRLANEILLDYHECLLAEMKNFDLVE